MAMVNFKKGLLASLPSTYSEGTFYVTTDDHSLHLDIDASTRIRLGDVELVTSISALPAAANAIKGKFYYAEAENAFCFPKDGAWQQVNPDTGATSVEVTGTGNAVTGASYDATTRKITLTKGKTFAEKSDLDALDAFVGDIPESYTEQTVIAYINKKAEETLSAASGGSSESAASVLAALNTYKSENDPKVATLEDKAHEHSNKAELDKIADGDKAKWDAEIGSAAAITAMKDGKSIDSFGDVETALSDYAKKTEAQGYVDVLAAKVGTVPENKTVVEMISDAQTAATYNDTAVRGLITAEADRAAAAEVVNAAAAAAAQSAADAAQADIDTLVGDDSGKSVRTIANEELAAQLIAENAAESLDTLEEIAAWIQSHPDDASAMNAAITALQNKVDTGDQTVSAYVNAAIAALNIGDYATAANLTALVTRVAALENDTHTHANKDVLDGITSAKVSAWNAAEQNAKTYADDLDAAMDARVDALEAIDHDAYKAYADQAEADAIASAKTYTDGLAGNYDASGAAADALTSAKAYADDLASNYDASGAAADALTEAKSYADQAEADAVSTAKSNMEAALTWGSFDD